jgi:hypothetical protein
VWPTGAEYTIVVRPFVLDVNSSQAVKLEPSGLARRGHGLFRRSAPQLDERGQQAEQWAVDRNFLIRPRRSLVRRFFRSPRVPRGFAWEIGFLGSSVYIC